MMEQATLEKVIEEVKLLTPAEQARVREVINSSILPSKNNPPSREEYEKYLLTKGVISHIPTRTGKRSEELKF